jgi:hypothetical protein
MLLASKSLLLSSMTLTILLKSYSVKYAYVDR